MAISDNASIEMELGPPTSFAAEKLTNPTADNQTYLFTNAPLSQQAQYPTVIMPQGVKSGLVCTPTANDDEVQTTGGVVINAAGAAADLDTGEITVAADSAVALTRATGSNVIINSIVVDGDGNVTAEAGTEGSGFSGARNVAGGPPFIPINSVEICQVKLTGSTPAMVLDSEISSVPGLTRQTYNEILWETDIYDGTVTFAASLPLIHTGGVAKEVWGRNSTPIFSKLNRVTDYSPAENSYTSNSTAIYEGAVVGQTVSLDQASFVAYLDDGLTDSLLGSRNDKRWIRFKQQKDALAHELTNGTVSITRTFPADAEVQATVNLLAAQESRAYDS